MVLASQKTANPTTIPAQIGQVVTFTIDSTCNVGLEHDDVVDDLPTGWAYVNNSTTITLSDGTVISGAAANPTISGQRLTWSDVGNSVGKPGMAAGGTLTVHFQAQTTAVPTPGPVTNNSTTTGIIGAQAFSSTSTATVTILPQLDLTVLKTNDVSDSVISGSSFSWNLLVSNIGTATTATFNNGNTILTDNLPTTGATYGAVTVTPGSTPPAGTGTISCTITTNNLSCTVAGGAGRTVTIPPGASFTVSFQVTTTATGLLSNPRSGGACSVDPGSVVAEGNENNNTCSNLVTVLAQPDLTVVKTNNTAGNASVNTPFIWTLQVNNAANTSVATFTNGQTILTDNLPATGATYGAVILTKSAGTTGTIACSIASNTLTCTANGTVTISSGESFTAAFPVTPTATGSLVNPTGGLCKIDPSGANGVVAESNEGNNTCSDTVIVTGNPAPDLTATKTNNVGGSVLAGSPFTWTVQVRNAAGAGTATFTNGQTLLTDNMPNGPTYGAATVISAGGTTGTIACSIVVTTLNCTASGGTVTVPANGSFSVSFSVTAPTSGTLVNPPAGGTDVCAADPNNVVSESSETNNTCTDTVTVAPRPPVISKSFLPNPILVGGTSVLTFTITNPDTTVSQADVSFTDNLPSTPGQMQVAAPPGISTSGCGSPSFAPIPGDTSLTFSGGTIAAGGTCTVMVNVTAPASGTYDNTSGAVSSTYGTGNTASASLTVNLPPDLTATKSNNVGGNVIAGNAFTWTVQVANAAGTSTATFASGQILLTDNLPAGPAYGAVTVTNGTTPPTGPIACAIAANTLTCTANGGAVTMPAGASFNAAFNVTPAAAGSLVNPTGGVCLADPNNVVVEADEGNNSCGDTVNVAALFAVDKNANPSGAIGPGGMLSYTVTVTNNGSGVHEGIIINDPLPSGTSYVANSTTITGPASFFYFDDLSGGYTGSGAGSATWNTNWTEVNDDNNSATGSIRARTGDANCPSGQNCLRLNADTANRAVYREADLSYCTSANLTYSYNNTIAVGNAAVITANIYTGTTFQRTVGTYNNGNRGSSTSGTIALNPGELTNITRIYFNVATIDDKSSAFTSTMFALPATCRRSATISPAAHTRTWQMATHPI